MIEMLVAMAATMIMVLFLNQIFTSLSNAVSMGKGTSVIVENARIIAPQLQDDTGPNMVPPAGDGVLVVISRFIQGDFNGDGDTTDAGERDLRLTRDSVGAISPGVRSDQVMWIKTVAPGELPMAPSYTYQFGSNSGAGVVKMWYGHVLRTNGDGSDTDPDGPNIPAGNGPEFADLAINSDGSENVPNRYAVNWILGRQALFLEPPVPNNNFLGHGGWWYADMTPSATPRPPQYLYHGTTDVAYFGFDAPTVWGQMIGAGTNPAGGPDQLDPAMDSADFLLNVLPYTYAFERLRVNVDVPPGGVDLNGNGQIDPGTNEEPYDAWQITQGHAFLAEHVIEFAVQFAGDYDADAGIDVWDHDANPLTPVLTRWYDMDVPPSATGVAGSGLPVDVAGSAKCFVTAAPAGNPQPIYAAAPGPHADEVFIFRNGAGATNWPMLLRFRYRLTDSQGRLTGADGFPGKLFEQIIAVP